jgi:selenide,water dikinase
MKMRDSISILSECTDGGCGAKISSGELSALLDHIPKAFSPNLIVGYDSSDDAAVYKIDEENSLVSTVDFFSAMVDDPRTFGRIAAANALSDVYAMGAVPLLALNLVCFPKNLSKSILAEILAGGAEKIAEAGATVGGGHSIYDREVKYGLAVTGLAKTKSIIRNNTPRAGDKLILTKPLGIGIVMAALRAGEAEDAVMEKALFSMQRLNRYAAEKMRAYNVSACTDVTGFGLLIHLMEMCGTTVSVIIDTGQIPIIPGAMSYAEKNLLGSAGRRNRDAFVQQSQSGDISALPLAMQELLFDPQTSGGLLISVDAVQAAALLEEIRAADPDAGIIGQIVPNSGRRITFTNYGTNR